VNKGFFEAYLTIRTSLYKMLKSYCDVSSCSAPLTRMIFTGHSIGGALATLAATDKSLSLLSSHSIIEVHTFGAPHVGGACFKQYFDRTIDASNVIRYVNALDVIPRLFSLVNITEQFPGVSSSTAFQLFVSYCHIPDVAVTLGGHLDVSMDLMNNILGQIQDGESGENMLMDSLTKIGLSPIQQHSMGAYISGIEANLGGLTRYVKIIGESEVVRGAMKKAANGVIEYVKQESLGSIQDLVVHQGSQAGMSAVGCAVQGGIEVVTSVGLPWVGLVSGANLLVNVVGHAATNYQLHKLRGQIDDMNGSLDLLNMTVENMGEKVSDISLHIYSMDKCLQSGFQAVNSHLHNLSTAVNNIPDQLEDILIKRDIQQLKSHLNHIHDKFNNFDYNSDADIKPY
jgi:hypothetical protein